MISMAEQTRGGTAPATVERSKRSRSGCRTCRDRRVKCDEVKPLCGNCLKLGASCVWALDAASTNQEYSQRAVEVQPNRQRKKHQRRLPTCIPCHTAKARCSHSPPICQRCLSSGLSCTWPGSSAIAAPTSSPIRRTAMAMEWLPEAPDGSWFPEASDEPSAPAPGDSLYSVAYSTHQAGAPSDNAFANLTLETVLVQGVTLRDLVNAFFQHVHPTQAMSFLHQGQLLRDIKEQLTSPLLIRAICAVSLRFVNAADRNHPDGGMSARQWAEDVKTGLVHDTDQHESNSGRLLSGWMWVAPATRMALAMGLDSARFMAKSSTYSQCLWTTQETARRLMWSTVCADALGSSAHAKYQLLHTDIDIPLPAEEHVFRMGQDPDAINQSSSATGLASRDGFMSRWVRLMLLRRSVLSYGFHGHQDPLKPWHPGSTFYTLKKQLDSWMESIPPDLAFTVDNLYVRQSVGELSSIAGIHLLYDLVRISLFRVGISSSFDGPNDYPDMPMDFTEFCHRQAYGVGFATRDRLRLIEDHFPDFVSSSRLWIRSVHAAIRVQLEGAHGFPLLTSRAELLSGFKTLISTVVKMTRYFWAERQTLRDLLDMLAQNGYDLYSTVDVTAIAPGSEPRSIPGHRTDTAAAGSILSDIPWIRRSVQNRVITDVGLGGRGDELADNLLRGPQRPSSRSRSVIPSDPISLSALQPSGGIPDPLQPSDQDAVFSLWTHYQPESHDLDMPNLQSMLGLSNVWT